MAGTLPPDGDAFQGDVGLRRDAARLYPADLGTAIRRTSDGWPARRRTLRTAARFAQHWNFDDGTIEEFGRARDALYQQCAEIGRDPAELRLSAQARFGGDPAQISATAAAYGQAGAQLLIISLPPPHTPAVLEPLATALRELC